MLDSRADRPLTRIAAVALSLFALSCAGSSSPSRTPTGEDAAPIDEMPPRPPRTGGSSGAGGTPAGGTGGGSSATDASVAPTNDASADAGSPVDARPQPDGGALDATKGDTVTGDAATADAGPAVSGPAVPSEGCGKANADATGTWVEKRLKVGTADRKYWIRIPKSYDPKRAYRTVILLHGCGDDAWKQTNNVPMERVTGEDAIVIRGYAADRCWADRLGSVDMAYFDELVKTLKAERCTDTSRFFAVGYSSGAWFANYLDCVRGDVLRASGTLSGGIVELPATCVGRTAHIFVHDKTDTVNRISGSEKARDIILKRNMCNTAIPPVPTGPAPCVRYQGCLPGYQVDWCATTGHSHTDRQDGLVPGAMWRFFSEL